MWKKITHKKGEAGSLCIECADKRDKKLGINLFWKAKEGEYEKISNITTKLEKALELREDSYRG